ncbi:hypothetical protein DBR17_07100 [Sphingomonas sp. HMWF008]|nr:hypothetical protein DBR17_07100 [Sphingomonas sp. HMWF008]
MVIMIDRFTDLATRLALRGNVQAPDGELASRLTRILDDHLNAIAAAHHSTHSGQHLSHPTTIEGM